MDKRKVKKIIDILREQYPEAKTELIHEKPLELLVATILSAQCTDERVNKVTPILFSKYKTSKNFAEADIEDIKNIIKSTGFYNQKAKFIKNMAKKLHEDYNGQVPDEMEQLLTLPGVARKTANVVLSSFNKAEGVVVDTHVKRISYRLGLTEEKNPVKIEANLVRLIPKKDWIFLSNGLIWHGRKICKARRPLCSKCQLFDFCRSGKDFLNIKE